MKKIIGGRGTGKTGWLEAGFGPETGKMWPIRRQMELAGCRKRKILSDFCYPQSER